MSGIKPLFITNTTKPVKHEHQSYNRLIVRSSFLPKAEFTLEIIIRLFSVQQKGLRALVICEQIQCSLSNNYSKTELPTVFCTEVSRFNAVYY